MKLTAHTITDEQIRELQNAANTCTEMACSSCHEIWRVTQIALHDPSWGYTPNKHERDLAERNYRAARARCAEILNERQP